MVTTSNQSSWDEPQSDFKLIQTKHNSLNVLHQNIRGLQHKIDELTCMLHSHDLSPHIICLTEHYLVEPKLLMIKPENYYLASNFSRQLNTGGGVCIYCKLDLTCNVVDISKYCIEKVIEACAIQMKTGNMTFIFLCIYRSPSGNIQVFINQLEIILKFYTSQSLN